MNIGDVIEMRIKPSTLWFLIVKRITGDFILSQASWDDNEMCIFNKEELFLHIKETHQFAAVYQVKDNYIEYIKNQYEKRGLD